MADTFRIDPAFNNSGDVRLQVPGHGLPLDYWPEPEVPRSYNRADPTLRFRHGANDYRPDRMVIREIAMLQLVSAITEKQNWQEKVFNPDILSKWKSEALKHPHMSEAAFEWCVKELQDKSVSYKHDKIVVVFDNASGIAKSDELISKELQSELKAVLQPLQTTTRPDWHPNSNEQVLNLVHPSLFPLVYEHTQVLPLGVVELDRVLDKVGQGEVVPKPDPPARVKRYGINRQADFWSQSFQWLPAEVKFKGISGTDVEITSYINNLHPVKHRDVYSAIEKFISASIEPWNQILIKGFEGRKPLRIKTYGVEIRNGQEPAWVDEITKDGADLSEELWDKIRDYMRRPNRPGYHPDDAMNDIPDTWEQLVGWNLRDVIYEKTLRIREFVHPEPGKATSYEDWKQGRIRTVVPGRPSYNYSEHQLDNIYQHEFYNVCLEQDFRDRGLQVIVKLASIELSPDKPSYGGGSWHVEGMLNEHIVATSIYYYDVENTTESSIAFRQEAYLDELELRYEQSDHQPLRTIFGCDSMDNEPAIQDLGNVLTPEGRLIAFPNTLQHRVSAFELIDPTKSGHRRFLVLWLVDPHLRIMSTANVSPQQHEWWASEATDALENKLPQEIKEMALDYTSDWPMSLEKAEEYRLQLMAERTLFKTSVKSHIATYNLCEH